MKKILLILLLLAPLFSFAQIPTNGLIAYYPFNGNANDASGNGNHGTIQNGVSFSTDRFGNLGKAAIFDGVDDWISTSMQQTNLSGYTVSGWFKTTDNEFAIVQNRGLENGGGTSLTLRYWEGRWGFSLDGDFIWIGKYIPYTNDSNWIHVTGTWDSRGDYWFSESQFKLYINGQLVSTTSETVGYVPVPANPNGFVKIGRHDAWNQYFGGSMDDLLIYNRALNDSEVSILYSSETNAISLATPTRIGGGLTTLKAGTNYNFTTTIKNNGSTTWVGSIYRKVKNETPVLISSNAVINAGTIYQINTTFTPQASQIGQNVQIELLTRQGTNDFVNIGAINGTKNPVLVNIIPAITQPGNDKPFLFLSKSEASPGEAITISGGGFKPSTLVKLGYTSAGAGAVFPSQNASADGSILFNFTIPNNFASPFITFLANDIDNKNPTANMAIRQNQILENITILAPNTQQQQQDGFIYVRKETDFLWISWKDKLKKSSNYSIQGAKRAYAYKIEFILANGQVENIKQNYEGAELLESVQVFKHYLNAEDLYFKFGLSGQSSISGKFKITDLLDPSRTALSDIVNIKWILGSDGIALSKEWPGGQTIYDKDGYVIFNHQRPIQGITADGVARHYFKLDFIQNPNASQIQRVEFKLIDPDNTTNTDASWIGKIMLADQNKVQMYTDEANVASQIIVSTSTIPANKQLYFWYVAPDDFQKSGKPYADSFGRSVKAEFKIFYTGQQTPITIENNLWIIRPPLMFVHGWMGDESSFIRMDNSEKFRDWFVKKRAKMKKYASFDENSAILLDGIKQSSSFLSVVNEMRREGIVSSQVDYISHSMGGLMLRNILSKKDDNSLESQFFQTDASKTYPVRNYQKGWVHKYITINTPHFGSPGADLLAGMLPILSLSTKSILVPIMPEDNGIMYYNSTSGKLIPSDAVRDMQTNFSSEGKTNFKEVTKVKSHAIFSDVDETFPSGNPVNTDLTNPDNFYSKIYNGTIRQYNLEVLYLAPPLLLPVFVTLVRDLSNLTGGLDLNNNSLFVDFINKNQTQLNNIWAPYWSQKNQINKLMYSKLLLSPFGLVKLDETMRLWGSYNSKYSDFLWNSDIIVPVSSQISGLPLTATNISIIPNSEQTDFDNFHVGIQGKEATINRVFELLNISIHNAAFGNLPENKNFQKVLEKSTPSSLVNTNTENTTNPKEVFDKSKISIESPSSDFTIHTPDILTIQVSAFDTVHLKRVELILGKDVLVSDTTLTNYYFNYGTDNFVENAKNQIMAVGYYLINNEIYTKLDTVSIKVVKADIPIGFRVSPEVIDLPIGDTFIPNYLILYPNSISSKIDKVKLNVEINNVQLLRYNAESGKFSGLGKGEVQIIFTYENTFKDTMYVAIGGGGLPYSQTITTNELSSVEVCTGQTIQIPFTIAGGTFDENNQFLVQLSDKTGENFQTISSTGSASPLSVKIPNDIEPASGYKIRVISTYVPVLGSASPTTLSISSFGPPPTVTTNKFAFWSGESIVLSASACPGGQTIRWSTGQTSSSITLTPTESASYTAVCTNGICETKTSIPVFLTKNYCPVDYVKNTNTVSGTNVYKASTSIQANYKISGTGTKETLEAPATILKPGFETQSGTIFTVQIGGCSN